MYKEKVNMENLLMPILLYNNPAPKKYGYREIAQENLTGKSEAPPWDYEHFFSDLSRIYKTPVIF